MQNNKTRTILFSNYRTFKRLSLNGIIGVDGG